MPQRMHGRLAWFTTSAVLVTTLLAVPAGAGQSPSADSRRLDLLRQDVQTELRRAHDQAGPPSTNLVRLRDQLEDLRDEVGYFRVVQRRGQSIDGKEYRALESRLQTARQELRNLPATTNATTGATGTTRTTGTQARGGSDEIAVGTELDVRLQNPLSSETAQVEDRFEATTVVDLYQQERLIVPAGSLVRGLVSAVDRASRTDRRGSLTVVFDEMTVQGRTYPIRAGVAEAFEAGVKGEVGKIGAGAGVGAIIGGILGGTKGALAGILIGGGGTVLATEGNDVDLEVGTVMRIRFESPVQVSRRAR